MINHGGSTLSKKPNKVRVALEQDGYIYRDYFSPNLVFADEETLVYVP